MRRERIKRRKRDGVRGREWSWKEKEWVYDLWAWAGFELKIIIIVKTLGFDPINSRNVFF